MSTATAAALTEQNAVLTKLLAVATEASDSARELLLRDQLQSQEDELADLRERLKRTTIALVTSERRLTDLEAALESAQAHNWELQRLLVANTASAAASARPSLWWAWASPSSTVSAGAPPPPPLVHAGGTHERLLREQRATHGSTGGAAMADVALTATLTLAALAAGLAVTTSAVLAGAGWALARWAPVLPPAATAVLLDTRWSFGGGTPWLELLLRGRHEGAPLYLYAPSVAAAVIGFYSMARLTALVTGASSVVARRCGRGGLQRRDAPPGGLQGKTATVVAFVLRYASSALAGLAMHHALLLWLEPAHRTGHAAVDAATEAVLAAAAAAGVIAPPPLPPAVLAALGAHPTYAELLLTPWVATLCEAVVYGAGLLLALLAPMPAAAPATTRLRPKTA